MTGNNYETKNSYATITVDLVKPIPHYYPDGRPFFDNRSYKVKPSEIMEIAGAVEDYLEEIKYPYVRVYFSGATAEINNSTLSKEAILKSIENEKRVQEHLKKMENEIRSTRK